MRIPVILNTDPVYCFKSTLMLVGWERRVERVFTATKIILELKQIFANRNKFIVKKNCDVVRKKKVYNLLMLRKTM